MNEFFVAPIVEGHGEVEAVPILLHRLLNELKSYSVLRVNPALRVKAGSFLNDNIYFARYLELAARKAKLHTRGSVLVLLDCEDSCPAQLGPRLAQSAANVRSDVPVIVALACREYETWFLAAARSLRGINGLPTDLEPPSSPEAIRNAKGWLSDKLQSQYNEPNDQPILTRHFSFNEAATVPSFDRLRRRITEAFTT